jgi:hypothetical protein
MKRVTVYIIDKQYNHFIELVENLRYVRKIETDYEPSKEDILNNIRAGLEELRLFKKGELTGIAAKDFLDEL